MTYKPVFGLVPNPNGPGVMALDPTECPNGHTWLPQNTGKAQRGYRPCSDPAHRGHSTWRCDECGGMWHDPPLGEKCDMDLPYRV